MFLVYFIMRLEFHEHAKKQNEIESGVNLPESCQKVKIECDHNGRNKKIGYQYTVFNTNVDSKLPSFRADGLLGDVAIDPLT